MERLTIHPAASAAGALPDAAAGTTAHPTTTAEVQQLVRDAIARGGALRIVGRGTWLDAGRPVRDADAVLLSRLSGIVDYTPGDLTLTARAGTTLAEIANATRPHGQWLALTPWGGDAGSLGATAATATAGPVSGALGAPRDVVIGLEAVTGAGDVVRGGGRVVKNVAGFDLTRLMVGAWGTLGVLTEVSVRLRGLPDHDLTLAMPVPNATAGVAEWLSKLRAAAIAPLALEIVSDTLAAHLGLPRQHVLIARIAGNAESVRAQRAVLADLGELVEADEQVWSALRTSDTPGSTIVRLSGAVARFAETWSNAARLAAAAGGHVHASVMRSTARVIMPHVGGAIPADARAMLAAGGRDTRIFERLPNVEWEALAASPVRDRLAAGVRAAFDPHRVLNPGILGEEGS